MVEERTERVRELFDDLVRFETVLWSAVDERLQREAGIALGALNVLLVVDATPDCRVQDIARSLAITVGGTSQAVDRVEKAGWCRRRSHPSDRRSSVIELTDEGVAVLRRAEPVFDAALDVLLVQPLSSSGLAGLEGALGSLRRAAGADRPPPRRGQAGSSNPGSR